MIKIINLEGKNKFKIILEEDLTINTIENTMDEIDKIFENCEELLVEVKNVQELDLTYLQLFYSLYESFKSVDKKINFNFNFSEEYKTLIRFIGFDKVLNRIK